MILMWKLNGMVLNTPNIGVSKDHEAEGSYKIKDLNSLDNDFELIHISCNSKTPISDKCKDLVRKDLFKKLKEIFA
jgi:hypothetical protein